MQVTQEYFLAYFLYLWVSLIKKDNSKIAAVYMKLTINFKEVNIWLYWFDWLQCSSKYNTDTIIDFERNLKLTVCRIFSVTIKSNKFC